MPARLSPGSAFALALLAAAAAAGSPPVAAQPSAASPERAATDAALLRAAIAEPRVAALLGRGDAVLLDRATEAPKEDAAPAEGMRPGERLEVLRLRNPSTGRVVLVHLAAPAEGGGGGGAPRVLGAWPAEAAALPLQAADVEAALALARRDPAVRRAFGDALDRFSLDPAAGLVVEHLRTRGGACTSGRCLELLFRTPEGYLPRRVFVDLDARRAAPTGGR